jgi:hypothetical protein
MRKLAILGLVLFGGLAIVAWRAAPATKTYSGTALSSGTIPNLTGNYSFAETIHDPLYPTQGSLPTGTGQEGTAVGTLTLLGDSQVTGVGQLTGVYTQNTRGCVQYPSGLCGDLELTRVPITGTYTLHSDGSITLDLILSITLSNTPDPAASPQQPVCEEAIWEGSFSVAYIHLRYTQTVARGSSGPCPVPQAVPFTQSPNVVVGTADKL